MPPLSPADQAEPAGRSARRTLLPAVLLGVCGLTFAGLAAPSAPPSQPVVSAANLSSLEVPATRRLQLFDGPPRTTVLAAPTPIAAPKPPVPAAKRASRSRPAVQADRYVRPSPAAIISPFGMRWGRLHKGVDFGAPYGAEIRAAADAIVVGAGNGIEDGYGGLVLLRHKDGVVTAYAHMSQVLVHSGDRVTAGQVVGLVGSTGHSTGAHLHFEVRIDGSPVDPVPWLRMHGILG